MDKVVFISHGHPDLSKGGAEVASWNLYQLLKSRGIDCLYIARNAGSSHGGSVFSKRGEEVLFHTGMNDWFNLSTDNTKQLFNDLSKMLQHFKPQIVHIHHYAHIGIELFAAVKQAVPDAKIVFTLHEFMAICMHNGQMVRKQSLDLCSKADFSDCHNCFPQHSPGDFLLRKSYVQNQFAYVDEFISPSQFLADRYIEWGLEKEKISVIENVLPALPKLPVRELAEREKRSNFAFLGQINPYKGIDLLLEAILLLPPNVRERVNIDIHGANLDVQESQFKEKVKTLLAQVDDVVTLKGPYEASQLPDRLLNTDWVIIPSIWWENSPVVIQEAIRLGRPLIGSNIGGMKEKIEEKAGLTFEARNPVSLAAAMVEAIEPEVFEKWHSNLQSTDFATAQHIAFLENLTLTD